jgi:hypothetical protein
MANPKLDNIVKQILIDLDRFIDARDEFEIPALKRLEGDVKFRIHNEGLASDGTKIGARYSSIYEKFKAQIVGTGNLYPINLELYGDLRKSLTTGVEGGLNVMGFQDDVNRKKAAVNETRYRKDIYKPSGSEVQDMGETLALQIRDVIIRSFRN